MFWQIRLVVMGMMLMLLIVNIKEQTLSGVALYAQIGYWMLIGVHLLLMRRREVSPWR